VVEIWETRDSEISSCVAVGVPVGVEVGEADTVPPATPDSAA